MLVCLGWSTFRNGYKTDGVYYISTEKTLYDKGTEAGLVSSIYFD